MAEVILEIGNCDCCGEEINLAEAWRVDEKYYCQNCFETLDV
jgi:formylmethanofuran dehydrogenase subunit E